MPLTGNRLGPRAKFGYKNDQGAQFMIRTDADLGAAGGMEEITTGATLPTGTKPRYLNLQYVDGNKTYRKRLICQDANEAPYVNNLGSTVTIDGINWTVTGKVGEKLRGI